MVQNYHKSTIILISMRMKIQNRGRIQMMRIQKIQWGCKVKNQIGQRLGPERKLILNLLMHINKFCIPIVNTSFLYCKILIFMLKTDQISKTLFYHFSFYFALVHNFLLISLFLSLFFSLFFILILFYAKLTLSIIFIIL